MAYPPDVPAGIRINTTGQVDLHPADHNEIHAALTDIINVLGADPGGPYVDVSTAIANILANALVPPGVALIDTGGDPTPSGWVKCRGQTVAKADMPLTWARYGDRYGVSTDLEFYVPDLRQRVPLGADPTVSIFDTVGETGGSRDSVLMEHDHDVDPPQTNISIPGGFGKWINRVLSGGGGTSVLLNQTNYGGEFTAVQPTVNIASFKSGNAGGAEEDGVDKNLQPFIVVDYIIRQV